MKDLFWGIAAVLLLSVAAAAWAQNTPPEPPALTDVQQLRLELHQAHVTIAQLQTQLAQMSLALERQAVTLDVLKDKPGYEIEWTSLTLKKVEPKK